MEQIIISGLRIAISVFYETYLDSWIKKWWKNRRLAKNLIKKIEKLCLDSGISYGDFLDKLNISDDFIKNSLVNNIEEIQKFEDFDFWEEHVNYLVKYIKNYFDLVEIELNQLYSSKSSPGFRALKDRISESIRDFMLKQRPQDLIVQIFKDVRQIKAEINLIAKESAKTDQIHDIIKKIDNCFDDLNNTVIKKSEKELDFLKEISDLMNNISHSLSNKENEITRLLNHGLKRIEDVLYTIHDDLKNKRELSSENITLSILELMRNYYIKKSQEFLEEEWPYEIEESTFVDNFKFSYGDMKSRRNQNSQDTCLSFIFNNILSQPIICIGYYGMGKTIISKMLFKRWEKFNKTIYPIYLNLTQRELKNFTENELSKQILFELKNYEDNTNRGNENVLKINEIPEEELEQEVMNLIKNKRIIIFFDGLDETLEERKELWKFLNFIFKKKFLFFITCRIEYSPFFDIFKSLNIKSNSYKCIELEEWGPIQWDVYIEGLKKTRPRKLKLINEFAKKIKTKTYSTLPSRPLFLKMLSDLELNEQIGIEIIPDLSSNIAEIYNKFIKWKIKDDYERKGGVFLFDKDLFERECFHILKEIAFLEYQVSLRRRESGITLDTIINICSSQNFTYFKGPSIEKIILQSSLFSILRRKRGIRYSFSHKSFMEYLMAYRLASCLFPGDLNPANSFCDDTWNYFHTHEISDLFIKEIERITRTLRFTIEERNQFLSNAFFKVLEDGLKDSLKEIKNEREQLAIFYFGIFNIINTRLIDLLESIIKKREELHPVFYRSASVVLSMHVSQEYCEDYVLYLLDDLRKTGKHVDVNREIQLRYYGKSSLRKTLRTYIDNYLNMGEIESLIALRIYSYFIDAPILPSSKPNFSIYLNQIYSKSIELKHEKIQLICQKIANYFQINLNRK